MIPHTDVRKYFPSDQSTFLKGDEILLNAVAVSPDQIDEAISEITETLRLRRGLKAHQESDFAAITDDSLLNLYNQCHGRVLPPDDRSRVPIVAGGGIGVMNIMLVSVTEARARSGSGWRWARSARASSCSSFEAMALTGTGGAIGELFRQLSYASIGTST